MPKLNATVAASYVNLGAWSWTAGVLTPRLFLAAVTVMYPMSAAPAIR